MSKTTDAATAHDVAAGVLRILGQKTTAMTLEKLVYYVQAWHLADFGEPAFSDEIQAWKQGPVVRTLYDTHRGVYFVRDWPSGNVARLSQELQKTIEWVVKSYGHMSAEKLSRMTHAEVPWIVAREGTADTDRSNAPIEHSVMRSYYARQRASASDVVSAVAASAALEGLYVDADWQETLQDVADGRKTADELVNEEIARLTGD
jgi:uncharacterized phage-associated protein